ncbi:MAG: hypothetical protein GX591_09515 [Planctomycetes bacterium]|nr:hypothetical protein [Planctomycetota bacterium]
MSTLRPWVRIADVVLIVVFVAVISLPAAGMLLGWRLGPALQERRAPAPLPRLGAVPLQALPEAVDAYYRDHFGFRDAFIYGHNRLRHRLLRASSDKVLHGRGDWLFYTGDRMFKDFMGLDPFTPEQLEAWRAALEGRQAWLAERGIRYLFVVAPNKAMIYPELLPDHIRSFRGRSRCEQLAEYLRDHSTVRIVTMDEAMIEAKARHIVYHANDSHWNNRGALVACRAVCARLHAWFPEIAAAADEAFEVSLGRHEGGLGRMLGLEAEYAIDAEFLAPAGGWRAVQEDVSPEADYLWTPNRITGTVSAEVRTNAAAQRRLLMFHDSFGRYHLNELLGEHFSRSVFLFRRSDFESLRTLVEAARPDVVIDELVERSLQEPLETHPEWEAARRRRP